MRHKDVYDTSVYAPMADLLAELADEFAPATSSGRIAMYGSGRTSAVQNRHLRDPRGWRVRRFKADGLTAGTGYFRMAPDQLADSATPSTMTPRV